MTEETKKETKQEWEQRFDAYGIGRHNTEYGYEHKIPNYEKVKDFIRTEIEAAREQAMQQKCRGENCPVCFSAGRAVAIDQMKEVIEGLKLISNIDIQEDKLYVEHLNEDIIPGIKNKLLSSLSAITNTTKE